jgi:hypothetical protein
VADLGQGAQLGDLPEPIRQQLGWQPPPTSREPTMEFTPGDRIRLLPGDDPPPSSRPMPEDPHPAPLPEVQVPLSGEDANAFAILGRTAAALRKARVAQEEIDGFFAEATSGDYDHLLRTTMAWVDWQ